MNSLSFSKFRDSIGALYCRVDEVGFTRVWGHLIDPENRVITFWRHERGEPWQFKVLETYQTPTPLAEKEAEKLEHGYVAMPLRSARSAGLLREIHPAFVRTFDEDSFHFVAKGSTAVA